MKLFVKRISTEVMGNKFWVKVYFNDGSLLWVPRLEEVAEIAQKIGICEQNKYPHGKGKKVPAEFLFRATMGESIKGLLFEKKEFEIPQRRK